MKTILLTLTYLVGVGELILAIYFWATNSKNEIRRVLGFLAMSTAFWVICSAFIGYRVDTPSALLLNRVVFVFGIFLISAFVHFASIFPYRLFNIDKLHIILFYIPAALFSLLSLTTTTAISSVYMTGPNDPGQIIGGPIYGWYNLYVAVLYVIGVIILFFQRKRADGAQKNNLSLLVTAFIIGGIPAVYLDLIIPFFQLINPNYLYGNIITAVWLGATTYIVLKK